MKTYKEVFRPARTDMCEDKTFCDLCKVEIVGNGWDINEVTIEGKTGYSCPSGGSSETRSVDMCIACFNNKLVPWLEAQGAQVEKTESGW